MIYDPRFIKLAPIECGDTYTIYRVVYAPEGKSPTLLGEMQVGRLSPETGYMIVKPYDLDHSLSRYFDLDYFTFPDTPAHLRYHTAALMSAITNVDLANKIDCEHIARIVTRIRRGLTHTEGSSSTARFDLFGEQLTGEPFDSCFIQLWTNWRGRSDEEIRRSIMVMVARAWIAFQQACQFVTSTRPHGEASDVLFGAKYEAVIQRLERLNEPRLDSQS